MSWFTRSRPRGTRQELPAASPGSSIFPSSGQWGSIPLPLASTTTVLGLPAANRAKSLISNAVAQMAPMEMWGADGFIADNPPNILVRPNVVYTCFDFFQMATELAIVRGNFLGIQADFDGDGYAQQIVPVAPGFWLSYIDGNGYQVYSVSGYPILSRDQVVHIRANGSPQQPMGVGVVEQFRRALGKALDEQNYAADTFRSGSVPTGTITLDLPEVEQRQSDYVQAQWLTNHSGGRVPAVLPNTMKFQPISWSPLDMDFLNQEAHTIGEIAHMFNMDPTDLGAALAGASMTYANIEQRQQQRITDTYAPWMLRFEQEWTDLIPGKGSAKLCPRNLLRTDSKTQAEVDQLEVGTSMRSTDELRKRDGRRPLPYQHIPAGTTRVNPDGSPVHTPTPPVAPGAAGGENPVSGGGVESPTPVPGTDIMATPVKVKE